MLIMRGWGYSVAVLVGALFGWLAQQFWLASQADNGVTKVSELAKSEQRIKRLSESDLFSLRSAGMGLDARGPDSQNSGPALLLLNSGQYQALLQEYQNNRLVYALNEAQLRVLMNGLIELGLYQEALTFLNDLLERASYQEEERYEAYMAKVVAEIDDVLSQSFQWQRLSDMYAWLVSVQPSYIPYVLRFVHWLIETNRYQQASSQLVSARNDLRYAREVERLEDLIAERESFQSSGVQRVPLERVGKQFVVELEFEYGESARLLIDTGASLSVIKESELSRLALSRLDREAVTMQTANGSLEAEKLTAPSVSLGGRVMTDVDVVTTPLRDFAYDGLLGMSVLGRLKFYIDQEQSALVIGQF